MRKQHNETSVLKSLRMKQDVIVNPVTKELAVLSGEKQPRQDDLGNGSWGKIDFLRNHCGYRRYWVDEFPQKQADLNEYRQDGWLV